MFGKLGKKCKRIDDCSLQCIVHVRIVCKHSRLRATKLLSKPQWPFLCVFCDSRRALIEKCTAILARRPTNPLRRRRAPVEGGPPAGPRALPLPRPYGKYNCVEFFWPPVLLMSMLAVVVSLCEDRSSTHFSLR